MKGEGAPLPRLAATAWWFPAAFAAHNFEEALWLPAWSVHAAPFHAPVGAVEFRFAVAVLTLLSAGVTALARARGGAFSHAAVGTWAMMLGNVLMPHLAATLALGRYAPGLGTGVILIAPVGTWLLWGELRSKRLGLGRALVDGAAVTAMVLAAIPLLFLLGQRLEQLAL